MRIVLLLLVVFLPLAMPAQANLTVLSNGLVNDTDQNITWIQDVNLVVTSCHRNDALWQAFNPPVFSRSGNKSQICRNGGGMDFEQVQSWVDALNAVNYLGYNDWRLPDTVIPDPSCTNPSNASGYRCVGSELGYLMATILGNPNHGDSGCASSPAPFCLQNTGPFSGLSPYPVHMRSPNSTSREWHYYGPSLGYQYSWIPPSPGPIVGTLPTWPVAKVMVVRDGLSQVLASAPAPGPSVPLLPRPFGSGQGLVDLGNGLVADTSQNITWLKDANMVKTSCDNNDALWQAFTPTSIDSDKTAICAGGGYLVDEDIDAWIELLNSQNYLGYNDWRMPQQTGVGFDRTCSSQVALPFRSWGSHGYGCLQSEMGRLWYMEPPWGLGNLSQLDHGCSGDACMLNSAPFDNLTGGQLNAWRQLSKNGGFYYTWHTYPHSIHGIVWPVRPGLSGLHLAPQEIPVNTPATLISTVIGLLLLASWVLRRRIT